MSTSQNLPPYASGGQIEHSSGLETELDRARFDAYANAHSSSEQQPGYRRSLSRAAVGESMASEKQPGYTPEQQAEFAVLVGRVGQLMASFRRQTMSAGVSLETINQRLAQSGSSLDSDER